MRIGPKMKYAVEIVKSNPGIIMFHVAKLVQPNPNGRSARYGYATCHRAIKASLIRRELDHRGANKLFVTGKGEDI